MSDPRACMVQAPPDRVPTSRGRSRRALAWLLYAVTTVCVSLLLVELAVRVLEIGPPIPGRHKRLYVRKEHLPFHPTPNSRFEERTSEFAVVYQYNAQGLRDRERSVTKPAGTVRILGLGDSFTEGLGVNFIYSYLSQLERLLRAASRPPPGIDVVKAGVAGYDTEAERLYLEYYGVHYEPDLVIVGLTGTDVNEMALGRHRVVSEQGYLLTRGGNALGWWGVEAYVRSRAARIVLKPIADRYWKDTTHLETKSEPRLREIRERGWSRITDELSRIREIARSIDAELIVLHIPIQPPFGEHSRDDARRLRAWCRVTDTRCVDMLPVFEAHRDPRSYYFPADGHCTPSGNRVIAETLFTELQRAGWLDRHWPTPSAASPASAGRPPGGARPMP